jgi:hypothetical protein
MAHTPDLHELVIQSKLLKSSRLATNRTKRNAETSCFGLEVYRVITNRVPTVPDPEPTCSSNSSLQPNLRPTIPRIAGTIVTLLSGSTAAYTTVALATGIHRTTTILAAGQQPSRMVLVPWAMACKGQTPRRITAVDTTASRLRNAGLVCGRRRARHGPPSL